MSTIQPKEDRKSKMTQGGDNEENEPLNQSQQQKDQQQDPKKSSLRASSVRGSSRVSETKSEKKEESSNWFNIFMIIFIIGGLGFVWYNNQDQIANIFKDVMIQFTEIDSTTIVLTDENFNEVLDQYDNVLVKFYAPWCGHCKKMAPEYAIAAAQIQEEFDNVRLAKMDATQYQEISNQYGVSGYPSLKWFSKRKFEDYTGGRTSQEIYSWISRKTGKASKLIESTAVLEKLKEQIDVVVIYFTNVTEGPEWDIYQQITTQFDTIAFGHIQSEEIQQHYGVKSGQLVLFKKFDEGINNYEGRFEYDYVFNFIDTNRIPIVMDFDMNAVKVIFQQSNKSVVLFVESETETLKQEFKKIAEELRGTFVFAIADVSNDKDSLYDKLRKFMGIESKQSPNLVIVDGQIGAMLKYIYEGSLNQESIRQYIEDFNDGKLEPILKSQSIPENNNGPIIEVVGKNFNEVIIKNEKDALLLFYAPWCGHCKSFKPEFERAAKLLEKNPNIILGQIDYTENEVPGIQVSGYPTTKFFPGNRKNTDILTYEGDRNAESIINFLKQNTSHPWVELDDAKNTEL